MKLSEVCVKRPVFSTVICLVLIIIGILGYNNLSLRFLPDYQPNSITVTTNYAAGSAQYIEDNITTPIEEQISGVSGIDNVQSISLQGSSMVTIALNQGANYEQTINDVRTRIELAKQLLPKDLLTPPVVQRGYMDMPLMRVGFVDSHMGLQAIGDFIERNVQDTITQINGVASVQLNGAEPYAMLVHLNPEKMSQMGLSVQQVTQAIKTSTEEQSAGVLRSNVMDFPVNEKTRLQTAAEYRQINVKNISGRLIKLADIADVSLTGYDTTPSIVKVNGKPAITMQIMSTTDSNEIQTAEKVKSYLKRLQTQAPLGMQIIPYADMSSYMKDSIYEVYLSIYFAILCVVLVVYLFLGSARTSLVPIMTIPICLIATFALMDWMGFTINMITLIALILSIGLVVDDAIVVMENIYRHLETESSSVLAAIVGSREIAFSIVVMTLTLVAVYAPFGFIGGMAAAFLKPFAFTLAGAVLISGFVSLTLSPMMCARLLKKNQDPGRYERFVDRVTERWSNGYKNILGFILKVRVVVVLVTVLIAFSGFYLVKSIPFEASPPEDVGFLFLGYRMTKNEDVRHVDTQLSKLVNVVKKYPEVKTYVSIAQSANVFNFPSLVIAVLKPLGDRKKSSATLTAEMESDIKKMPGLNAFAQNITGGGSGTSDIEFVLSSPDDYVDLHKDVDHILQRLGNYPGLYQLKSNVNFDTQSYDVSVKRNLAAQLNVSISDINDTISTLIGGKNVASFTLGGKNYYSYVLAPDSLRENINALSKFKVPNAAGDLLPLSQLIDVQQTITQASMPHYNRQHAATITGQLTSGYDLGTVIKYLQNALPQMMPQSMHYAFLGSAKDAVDSNSSIGLLFILALVFIYLVMAAQFESFLDPLIILCSVPLCIVSALAGLKLFGGTLNLYTNVALITLIGLIAKHGILITHFANQLYEQGHSAMEALIEAAAIRLRPILMTTAATTIGAAPLLFAFGAGSNSRHQIGLVIVVGMLCGTFFSLIVVPVAYSLAHQMRAKFRRGDGNHLES